MAQSVPGGPVERATYDAIKADYLEKRQIRNPDLPLNGGAAETPNHTDEPGLALVQEECF